MRILSEATTGGVTEQLFDLTVSDQRVPGIVRAPEASPQLGLTAPSSSGTAVNTPSAVPIDWQQVSASLDLQGCAVLPDLLDPVQCQSLRELYGHDTTFRKRVVMARHGYGRGEYKYFDYPLPALVADLRDRLYAALVPIANRWHQTLGVEVQFPSQHAEFLARCHAAGQLRPTPLLLQYGVGDYNCLHQDLYGEHVFPLQVTVLLHEPGRDFTGGEFVMTEQRPRMQSRPMVVSLGQGDAVVFAVNQRPVRGARGYHRVKLRHGVSTLHSGQRQTLGLIFHDAS